MLLNENDVETVVQLSKGDIDGGSSERSDTVKAGDFGMISGYSKENKASETTSPSQKMPNSRSALQRKKRRSCRREHQRTGVITSI